MAASSGWDKRRWFIMSGGDGMKRGMRFTRAILGVTLLAALTFMPTSAQTPDEEVQIHITQVDTSAFPQVTIYLSVTDVAGEPVGIDPSRLQIYENATAIETDQIEGMGTVGRLSTLLIMDISGSMNIAGKLESAQAAAQAYIALMRPGDQMGLLTFNTEITYAQPLTRDGELLSAAVASLRAEEDTAMYDALVEGIDLLSDTSGRKAILVLTDGLDNRSTSDQADVLATIGPEGLSISTIGLGDPDQGEATNAGLDVPGLMGLASGAGGAFSYANDEDSLTLLYSSLARTLQSEYILTYTSPSERRDGFERELTVTLLDQPSASQGAGYNPGGLIPEVEDTLSFSVFSVMMVVLIGLLFLPLGINSLQPDRGTKPKSKAEGRIRFKD